MKKDSNLKDIFDKQTEKKILLRRKVFLEFGEIPEEILSILVNSIDLTKEYILRFLDDPEDFKYYIKQKKLLDYDEAVEEGILGKAKLKTENIEKIYGADILFGKYERQGKNIVKNENGNFIISSNYILKKEIEIVEGLIVEKEIEETEKTNIIEYCIYVPNILKFCNFKK